MSKQRSDVNTREEAELQPNNKPESPTHKEQAWFKTTTGQNAWGIRKENFFGCQIVENIPDQHGLNVDEIRSESPHDAQRFRGIFTSGRKWLHFMMRALRPCTWWQPLVSLLSPLMRLSADPGHMLEFTGRWPPSCRLPYLLWDLSRSSWNPTPHWTSTHTHTLTLATDYLLQKHDAQHFEQQLTASCSQTPTARWSWVAPFIDKL